MNSKVVCNTLDPNLKGRIGGGRRAWRQMVGQEASGVPSHGQVASEGISKANYDWDKLRCGAGISANERSSGLVDMFLSELTTV